MSSSTSRTLAAMGAVCLGFAGALASADDRPYTEGNVSTVSAIRTEYGRFDDYMKFLAGPYKHEMEAEKKAGLIVSYQIYQAQPHNPQEADVYLLVTYKNWAAFDGLAEKNRALLAQVYGSLASASQAAVDRGKIRSVLGQETIQELILK